MDKNWKKNKTIKKTPIETHETEGVLPKKVFFEYFEIPEDRKKICRRQGCQPSFPGKRQKKLTEASGQRQCSAAAMSYTNNPLTDESFHSKPSKW